MVPFDDDEDILGTAVRSLSSQLHGQGLGFEIIAVDEDSRDNSHALLTLVRAAQPELLTALHILQAPGRGQGRGYEHGLRHARGRILWLVEPRMVRDSLASLDWAHRQVHAGQRDVVVAEGRFAVAHWVRAWPVLQRLRGRGAPLHRRMIRRALVRRLAVEPRSLATSQVWAPLDRLISALTY